MFRPDRVTARPETPRTGNCCSGHASHQQRNEEIMMSWRTSAVIAALLCVVMTATTNAKPHKKYHHRNSSSQSGEVIGGRPSGCPQRFCGCALSIRIFGSINPRFNLAANWFSFPRTQPAPQMVAVCGEATCFSCSALCRGQPGQSGIQTQAVAVPAFISAVSQDM